MMYQLLDQLNQIGGKRAQASKLDKASKRAKASKIDIASKLIKVNRSANRVSVALLASSIFIGLCVVSPALSAEPMFDNGLRSYNQQEYKKAIAYFNIAITRNPENVDAIYYHALSCQAMGDQKTAIRDYARIVSRNPNSQAGQYAARALAKWDPSYLRQLQRASTGGKAPPASPTNGGSGGGRMMSSAAGLRTYVGGSSSGGGSSGGDDLAGLPDGTTIYYTPTGNSTQMTVQAAIDGRSIDLCFDTGAHGVVVGKNHLADLHIPPPTGQPTGSGGGVGSSSMMPTWDMIADVKVGSITRRMPIVVYETMSAPPLLGQSFYNGYDYDIDGEAHSIRLHKKSAGSSGGSAYGTGVPFERLKEMPNHHIVMVTVNGRPMRMIFDTGADGVVFTGDQAKGAGISIPADAEQQVHRGVGGDSSGCSFPINSISMGPISKRDFTISVVQHAAMPFPLLGRTFFEDYAYKIDESGRQIYFKRSH
jgi:clan AA aspartic protease (TIGR02281 family)